MKIKTRITTIIFLFLMSMSLFKADASFEGYIWHMDQCVKEKNSSGFLTTFRGFLGLLKKSIDANALPEACIEVGNKSATVEMLDTLAKEVVLFTRPLIFSGYHLSIAQIQELLVHISVLSKLGADTVPTNEHVAIYRTLRGNILEYIDLSKHKMRIPAKGSSQNKQTEEPPPFSFDPENDDFVQIVHTSQPLINLAAHSKKFDATAQAEVEKNYVERGDESIFSLERIASFLQNRQTSFRKKISPNECAQEQVINELLRLYRRPHDGAIRSQLVGYEQTFRAAQHKVDERDEKIYNSLKKIEPVIEQLDVKKREALLRATRQMHETRVHERTPLVSVKIPGWADAVTHTNAQGEKSYSFPAKIGVYPGDLRSTFALIGQTAIDYRLLYKPYRKDLIRFRREKLKQDAASLVEQLAPLQSTATAHQVIAEEKQTSNTSTQGKKKKKNKKNKKKEEVVDQQVHNEWETRRIKFLETYLDKNCRYMSFKIFDNPSGKAMLTYLIVDKIVSSVTAQIVGFKTVSEELWQQMIYKQFPFFAIFDFDYLAKQSLRRMSDSSLDKFYHAKEAAHLEKEGAPAAPITWFLEPVLRPQANVKNHIIRVLHGMAKLVNVVGFFTGNKPNPKGLIEGGIENIGTRLKLSESNHFKNAKRVLGLCFDAVAEVVCFGITMKFLDQAYQACWKEYVIDHNEALYALIKEYQDSKKALDDLYAHDNPDIELLKQAEDNLEKIDAKISLFVEKGHELVEDNTLTFATGNPFWQHLEEVATSAEKMAMVIAAIFAVPTACYLGKWIYDIHKGS